MKQDLQNYLLRLREKISSNHDIKRLLSSQNCNKLNNIQKMNNTNIKIEILRCRKVSDMNLHTFTLEKQNNQNVFKSMNECKSMNE